MSHLKITFHLDGSGVYFDPNEPTTLDGLLCWVLAPKQGFRHLDRSEVPGNVQLPLMRTALGSTFIWNASALFPDGPSGEGLWFWRKRMRQSRIHLTTGSPNTTNGTYRDWQTPLPLTLCLRMVAYASGNGCDVRRLLREVRYIGKKAAHGHGKVIKTEVEHCEKDNSLTMDGLATRWLPQAGGPRLVRPRPPYWHPHGRIECCDIGSAWPPTRAPSIPTEGQVCAS
jgi:hypothetical protein